MVRGRTSLTGGYMVLGHEITGEVRASSPPSSLITALLIIARNHSA